MSSKADPERSGLQMTGSVVVVASRCRLVEDGRVGVEAAGRVCVEAGWVKAEYADRHEDSGISA